MAGIFLCLVSGVSGQVAWNPDYNGDGQVTTSDMLVFLAAFGSECE